MTKKEYLPRVIRRILPRIKEKLQLNEYHMFNTEPDEFMYYTPEKGNDFIFAMKWNSNGKVQLKGSNRISLPYLHLLFIQEFGENIIED